MGVSVPDAIPDPGAGRPDSAPVVTILAELADQPTMAAVLNGLRSASERFPGLLAAVEFPRANDAAGWHVARGLGLLPRLTALAGPALAARAVVASDLVILAEVREGPRAESLEALGHGVPTIALADPFADVLLEAETAVLLGPAEHRAAAWSDAILRSLEHPEQSRALAQRGRALVWARHRSSVAAAACLSVAQDLLHGSPLRYSPQ
jgi:glycosyltransferase involved in cell wall biosynthesis